MVKLSDLKNGAVVKLRPDFGLGSLITATVTAVESDIKNGRPGIDYTTTSGSSKWAYLDQIEKIIKKG